METRLETRPEIESDWDAVRKLHQQAFPTHGEARLVDKLRSRGDVTHSWVGIIENEVVGHALCSRLQAPFSATALAPVATAEEFRRQGVAGKIIKSIIEAATTQGWNGMFVLGNPDYYERFGFSAALAAGFSSPYQGKYFMVHSLGRGALQQNWGEIVHSPAFSEVD